jgi:hypothetical protein
VECGTGVSRSSGPADRSCGHDAGWCKQRKHCRLDFSALARASKPCAGRVFVWLWRFPEIFNGVSLCWRRALPRSDHKLLGRSRMPKPILHGQVCARCHKLPLHLTPRLWALRIGLLLRREITPVCSMRHFLGGINLHMHAPTAA